MTSNNSTLRRPRLFVWFILAAITLVFAWWMIAQLSSLTAPNNASHAPHPGDTLTWQPGDDTVGTNPTTLRPGVDPLHLNPRHAPLDQEPVDLEPYPDAVHQSRYATVAGGFTDEISFWSVPSDSPDQLIKKLTEHYTAAAQVAGYTPTADQAGQATTGRSLQFFHSLGEWRTLTVRLTPRRTSVHVTVWLRYAMTTP